MVVEKEKVCYKNWLKNLKNIFQNLRNTPKRYTLAIVEIVIQKLMLMLHLWESTRTPWRMVSLNVLIIYNMCVCWIYWWLTINPKPPGTTTLISFIKSIEYYLNFKYLKITANARYENEENYSFIEDNNQI